MKTKPKTARSIDEYVERFPADVQKALQKVRLTIRRAAPRAQEAISYGIPTFRLNGRYSVYFSAAKKHIGLYPAPMGVPAFKTDLARYGSGKGTLRLPLDAPMPAALITRVVKYWAKQKATKPAKRKVK